MEQGFTNLAMDFAKDHWNYNRNVKFLEADLRKLTCRASDIENEVKFAEGSGKKKRKWEVENWFEDVKTVKDDFEAFRDRKQGFSSYLLRGNRVAELREQVASLLEQSQYFNELVRDATENCGMPRITSKLFGEIFQKNFENILECLQINNVSLVGIYGMGGVGKATLVKHVHNHLLKNTNWPVHWFTISKEYTLKRLQNQIAKPIHLDLSEEED